MPNNTNEVPSGQTTHTLEEIDAGVSEVENAIGNAASLTAAIAAAAESAAGAAVNALDAEQVGGTGYYISSISELNGILSATAETMDKISMADVFGNVSGSDYQLSVGDDLNNILIPGNFTAGSTTIAAGVYNSPWNATRYKVISLIITGSTSANCRGVQILFPNVYPAMDNYPGVIFFLRYRHNATFTPWCKIGGTEVPIVTPPPQQNSLNLNQMQGLPDSGDDEEMR